MNIVSSTANKVLELEKRLDNQLVDKTIRVSEVSRVVESVISGEESFLVLKFDTQTDISVVVQGEVEVNTLSDVDFDFSLYLDGFEVYTKSLSVSAGDHSISIMKAINLKGGTSEELILKVKHNASSEVYFKGYNFFGWGYGESLDLGVRASEPKISATEKNDRYALSIALDNRAFVLYRDGFPENLEFGDFSYFGEFSYLEPIFDEKDDGSLELVVFGVSADGKLVEFKGELVGVSTADGEIIDENVVAVSATKVNKSDEIVVVYACASGEIKYFSLINGTRSSILNLTTMDEKISEVSLVQGCETTTFLVVGLETGRNYLFSSVTSVTSADKLSHLGLIMEVSFS